MMCTYLIKICGFEENGHDLANSVNHGPYTGQMSWTHYSLGTPRILVTWPSSMKCGFCIVVDAWADHGCKSLALIRCCGSASGTMSGSSS
ncbi:hypothetical protein GDO81_012306 [Engystomops pustulosus]|uniref:Uncharacterized protein n=1 Tax=Engystomops pustulosus TaxID=76066 RepID=A0AAV7BL57_ENGPU|nr:hypothetical protein GDO81_012306 [Engystomops pustulosus]